MVILGIIFCLVLLSTLGVSFYLRKQAIAYVKLSTVYTNKFMSCEITLQEYALRKEKEWSTFKMVYEKGRDINGDSFVSYTYLSTIYS